MKKRNKKEIRAARPDDWETRPMPETNETFMLHRAFSDKEMTGIRLGYIPKSMDDRWFCCMDGNILWLYRSWSGCCIYRVEFKDGNGHIVTVNRDPEQYSCTDIKEDVENLNGLLDWLGDSSR